MKYNEVYSNYVFKSVYKLHKKLNRDGVEVMDIWLWIHGIWIYCCGYSIIDISLWIYNYLYGY
jgi:hypothetical protein